MKRKLLITAAIIAAGLLVLFLFFDNHANAPELGNETEDQVEQTVAEVQEFDKTQFSTDDPNSIWVVVNKKRDISLDFIPADLVDVNVNKRTDKSADELKLRKDVAKALEELFAGATADNLTLLMGSAYRSAELQDTYYTNYVATSGQEEADKFSAKPGTSEHQTGLSADISTADKSCYLEICFSDTPEGKWLEENAHEYGFIIRYLEGKEEITGYQYEPWHVRYVGKELANEIYRANQVMEEFFEL